MEDWDQAKLEEAIKKKHTSENKNRQTDIICKYFLDAVERRLYGWFWDCPNGAACKVGGGGSLLTIMIGWLLYEVLINNMIGWLL